MLLHAAVSLALAVAPAPASSSATTSATPPAASPDEADAVDDALMRRSGELFLAGQSRFDTHDFTAAIEQWTQAYELLPDAQAYAAARAMILVGIATAHFEAWRIDGDLSHLRTAEALFTVYLDTLDPEDLENRSAVEVEREHIRTERIRAEDEQRAVRRTATDREADARAAVARQSALERTERERIAETRSARRSRALVVSGASLLALGGMFGAMMIAGLALGRRADRRGETLAMDPAMSPERFGEIRDDGVAANRLAWVGGAVGTALVGAGIGLLIAGHRARVRERRGVAASTRGHTR